MSTTHAWFSGFHCQFIFRVPIEIWPARPTSIKLIITLGLLTKISLLLFMFCKNKSARPRRHNSAVTYGDGSGQGTNGWVHQFTHPIRRSTRKTRKTSLSTFPFARAPDARWCGRFPPEPNFETTLREIFENDGLDGDDGQWTDVA
jgi:hypothetical protein